jgi:hypothetical protein
LVLDLKFREAFLDFTAPVALFPECVAGNGGTRGNVERVSTYKQ